MPFASPVWSCIPTVQQTILIVDDDAGIREALFYILRRDYRVLLAEDGGDAVETAETHRVDLAFVDVFLPTLNGFDVLERLAKLMVPVIMMSVISERAAGLSLGVADYLVKPVDREVLLSKLDRLRQRPPQGLASASGSVQSP